MIEKTQGLCCIYVAMFLSTLLWISLASAQDLDSNASELGAAIAAQAEHQAMLMSQPGVNAVGVGLIEGGTRVGIQIFVKPDTPKTALPAHLNGVPVEAIESAGFVAHDTPHTDTFARPVPMGVSTGNINGIFAGTLAHRVRRIGNAADVGYITNNHVASASGSSFCPLQVNPATVPGFNLNQCQPGRLDAADFACGSVRRIGKLVQAVPLVMGDSFLNTVDAVFVKSKRGCVSKNIRDIGAPSSTAEFPVLGSILKISGRTSGLKTIKVTTINATVTVSYGSCGSARFVNQAITTPVDSDSASLPGDSGAPVVRIVGTSKIPVGLNFAGDGFLGVINPMPLVLDALGVQIDTAADDPPAASCL